MYGPRTKTADEKQNGSFQGFTAMRRQRRILSAYFYVRKAASDCALRENLSMKRRLNVQWIHPGPPGKRKKIKAVADE